MSQKIEDKADAAEARTQQTKGFMQQVRVASRRKYTPEEKVRIVLEGFRREVAVNELCRREGIKPGAYYAWTKDFMEAGKERLTRDAVRDATRQEIEQIKRESTDLKHLVADLSLEVYRLKKRLFLRWATMAAAHECPRQRYYTGPGGKPIQGQTAGAHGTGNTKEQLLSVATGTTRFGKPEKTVEQDHSRRRGQGTVGSPGVF
ncbi:transposase [Chloroflexota bacterium]